MVGLEKFPAENFLANARTEGESLPCVKGGGSPNGDSEGLSSPPPEALCENFPAELFRNNPLRPPLHGGHLSQRERQDGFSGTARLSSLKKELPPGCKFSAIGRRFLCYCGVIRVYPKGFTSKSFLVGHDSQSEVRSNIYQLSLFRSVATKKRTIAPPKVVAQAATGPSFLLTKKGGKDVPKGVPPLGIPPLCREGAPFATLTSAQRHKLRRTAQVLR